MIVHYEDWEMQVQSIIIEIEKKWGEKLDENKHCKTWYTDFDGEVNINICSGSTVLYNISYSVNSSPSWPVGVIELWHKQSH